MVVPGTVIRVGAALGATADGVAATMAAPAGAMVVATPDVPDSLVAGMRAVRQGASTEAMLAEAQFTEVAAFMVEADSMVAAGASTEVVGTVAATGSELREA